jgi:hypothetical protein
MKKFAFAALLLLIFSSYLFSQQYDDLQEKRINNDRLKLFPSPAEGKNYFFLQSVDDKTQIVIGDFTQVDKKIILINLNDDYTTVKSVVEYLPVKKQLRTLKKSDSKFFTTDIVKLKRDIITGAIFKGNNAEDLRAYTDLESVFKTNDASRIFPETYGFSVKFTEPENEKLAAMFTFGNTVKGYYLQFKTMYYRENPVTERVPVLKYSVYSKNTHDPVIQEYVEELFKIRKPASSWVK